MSSVLLLVAPILACINCGTVLQMFSALNLLCHQMFDSMFDGYNIVLSGFKESALMKQLMSTKTEYD